LLKFAENHQIPVAETQAGKGAMKWDHSLSVGGIGVTGTKAANELAKQADVIIAIGSRLQDFTTESRTLFNPKTLLIQVNVAPFDVEKHGAIPLLGDCKLVLETLGSDLSTWQSAANWQQTIQENKTEWDAIYEQVTQDTGANYPVTPKCLVQLNVTLMLKISLFALRAVCPVTCTNYGVAMTVKATTLNMAFLAWVMK